MSVSIPARVKGYSLRGGRQPSLGTAVPAPRVKGAGVALVRAMVYLTVLCNGRTGLTVP